MKYCGQDKYFMKLTKYYVQDKYFMKLMKYYVEDKHFMKFWWSTMDKTSTSFRVERVCEKVLLVKYAKL